jgi:hypothetical protein
MSCSNPSFSQNAFEKLYNIDSLLQLVFNKEPQEKNFYFIDFNNEIPTDFLTKLLIHALNFKYNITSLQDITIEHIENIQKYFNSFGINILYYQNFDIENELAFDIGFEFTR